MSLFAADRHESLTKAPWSATVASDHIRHIVTKTLAEFHGEDFWSVHPNLQQEFGLKHPVIGLWQGAVGTMWGLQQLAAYQKPRQRHLIAYLFLSTLKQQQKKSIVEYPEIYQIPVDAAGYLIGLSAINLLGRSKLEKQARLFPSSGNYLSRCFIV